MSRIPFSLAGSVLLLLVASVVLAGEDPPSPIPCFQNYTCEADWGFDTDYDNWTATNASTKLAWFETDQLQQLVQTTTADGVLRVEGYGWEIKNSTAYLTPGWYGIALRIGGEDFLLDPRIQITGNGQTLPIIHLDDIYSEYVVGWFEVTAPGPVTIKLSDWEIYGNRRIFIDRIVIVDKPVAVPSPTPRATTTGTPATPTSVPQQATPGPTATPDCPPTATAPAPSFEPTPGVSVVESFGDDYNSTLWVTAHDAERVDISREGSSGSMYIPYGTFTTSSTVGHTDGVVMRYQVASARYDTTLVTMTIPFHVSFWAMTRDLPISQTASVSLWASQPGGNWNLIGTWNIGTQYWHPIHVEVTAPITGPQEYRTLAWTTTRTGTDISGGTYLDDVHIYQYESDGRQCTSSTAASRLIDGYRIYWPLDRPCPADLTRPNNFWGPILTALTNFLDAIYAIAPTHTPGLRLLGQQMLSSPMSSGIMVLSVIIDPTVPLIVTALYFGVQFVRGILSVIVWVWKLLPGGG